MVTDLRAISSQSKAPKSSTIDFESVRNCRESDAGHVRVPPGAHRSGTVTILVQRPKLWFVQWLHSFDRRDNNGTDTRTERTSVAVSETFTSHTVTISLRAYPQPYCESNWCVSDIKIGGSLLNQLPSWTMEARASSCSRPHQFGFLNTLDYCLFQQ
ncbi:hypothetical protein GWI33_002075 [Rhynchophorus ferrugineus]|uniref:Uncharacterized protein n=1 Tax=Rhynchophorus ferrugineus TaxID=354439 RepID=A0A834IU46_RHYFE|nr:hypothetical protein GWI33_002075 [Rhynchophorus ferrugineus]